MKIAVTAANGRLGRAIIKKLVNRYPEENVVGIARSPHKASDLGIEIRKGDYDRMEDFVEAFSGIEVAVIISSFAPPQVRPQQHRNIIEAAKEALVRKIIYTSICGVEGHSAFDPIIKSNRQTEQDVKQSGLQWIIGRNGLYIDADFESLDAYKAAGELSNSAGHGRCAYTSRDELANAYECMVAYDSLNNDVYNLVGEPISQEQLTDAFNEVLGTSLVYKEVSVEDYTVDRIQAHGEYLGNIIGGIYEGIREGVFDLSSDFKRVCAREHRSVREMMRAFGGDTVRK